MRRIARKLYNRLAYGAGLISRRFPGGPYAPGVGGQKEFFNTNGHNYEVVVAPQYDVCFDHLAQSVAISDEEESRRYAIKVRWLIFLAVSATIVAGAYAAFVAYEEEKAKNSYNYNVLQEDGLESYFWSFLAMVFTHYANIALENEDFLKFVEEYFYDALLKDGFAVDKNDGHVFFHGFAISDLPRVKKQGFIAPFGDVREGVIHPEPKILHADSPERKGEGRTELSKFSCSGDGHSFACLSLSADKDVANGYPLSGPTGLALVVPERIVSTSEVITKDRPSNCQKEIVTFRVPFERILGWVEKDEGGTPIKFTLNSKFKIPYSKLILDEQVIEYVDLLPTGSMEGENLLKREDLSNRVRKFNMAEVFEKSVHENEALFQEYRQNNMKFLKIDLSSYYKIAYFFRMDNKEVAKLELGAEAAVPAPGAEVARPASRKLDGARPDPSALSRRDSSSFARNMAEASFASSSHRPHSSPSSTRRSLCRLSSPASVFVGPIDNASFGAAPAEMALPRSASIRRPSQSLLPADDGSPQGILPLPRTSSMRGSFDNAVGDVPCTYKFPTSPLLFPRFNVIDSDCDAPPAAACPTMPLDEAPLPAASASGDGPEEGDFVKGCNVGIWAKFNNERLKELQQLEQQEREELQRLILQEREELQRHELYELKRLELDKLQREESNMKKGCS